MTIPEYAPAGANLDVIVTNPNLKSAPASQNQSGLLAGGITISPTSAFQPGQQFGTALLGGSPQVYDMQQRSMVNLQTAPPLYYQVVFNADGAELYGFSSGPAYWVSSPEALEWKLADDSFQAVVPVPNGTSNTNGNGIQLAVNPVTHGSILYVAGVSTNNQGFADLQLNMIDTNPANPTFNTIIETINAGLNLQNGLGVYPFAATPDGKYVYANYYDYGSGLGMLAIFDIVNGGPATILTMSSLGAYDYQNEVQVSPDGGSLLLQAYYDNDIGYDILVFDINGNPKSPTLLATITGSVFSGVPPYLYSFQVVGNRLFALDLDSGSVLAFNFDDVHSNFSQLAAYRITTIDYSAVGLAVSPDGALVYFANENPDMITVLDANLLAGGQPPLITNIATGITPYQVAVSPITAKYRVVPQIHKQPAENRSQPDNGHSLAE